jgi:hypothetical protein
MSITPPALYPHRTWSFVEGPIEGRDREECVGEEGVGVKGVAEEGDGVKGVAEEGDGVKGAEHVSKESGLFFDFICNLWHTRPSSWLVFMIVYAVRHKYMPTSCSRGYSFTLNQNQSVHCGCFRYFPTVHEMIRHWLMRPEYDFQTILS